MKTSIKPLALALTALPFLFNAPAQAQPQMDGVCVETNAGDFCMELLWEDAPNTVQNFLNYVTRGDYDNTLVHRSEPLFVIQTGGYSALPETFALPIREDEQIDNEFKVSNSRGTVAMAKFSGQPDSASNQWFINLRNNNEPGSQTNLDQATGGFTVFARVVSGMDVVDNIGSAVLANFAGQLGNEFGQVPVKQLEPGVPVEFEDLFIIERVYSTLLDSPEGVFYNQQVNLTVDIDGLLHRGTLRLNSLEPDIVLNVDQSTIQLAEDEGQEISIFRSEDGLLRVPSVQIGDSMLHDIVLRLTDPATMEFTVLEFEGQL